MLNKETREILERLEVKSILTVPTTKTRRNPVDFYKCRDVNDPTRAWSAAGIDFYMPRFRDSKERTEWPDDDKVLYIPDTVFFQDLQTRSQNGWKSRIFGYDPDSNLNYIALEPGERVAIPSGIKARFNVKDIALVAFNKSGVATKKGLTVGACVVDEDYLGEIHISLINTSNTEQIRLYENEKLVQFLVIPLVRPCFSMLTENEWDEYVRESGSLRGAGWQGSSDK